MKEKKNSVPWDKVWRKNREEKDFGFLWALYHKALVINERTGKIRMDIEVACIVCV
jgi:hypothetical protein